MALSLLGVATVFHVFDAAQGMGSFVLRGYRQTFWPMLIYGVALWGLGLGGGVVARFLRHAVRPTTGAHSGSGSPRSRGSACSRIALVWLTRQIADAAVASHA